MFLSSFGVLDSSTGIGKGTSALLPSSSMTLRSHIQLVRYGLKTQTWLGVLINGGMSP